MVVGSIRLKDRFSGEASESVEGFFRKFELFCDLVDYDDAYKCKIVSLYLTGKAHRAYRQLPSDVRWDYNTLKDRMFVYYAPTELPPDYKYRTLVTLRRLDTPKNFLHNSFKLCQCVRLLKKSDFIIPARQIPSPRLNFLLFSIPIK